MNKENYTIISLGGSLIVADEVQVSFLKEFKKFIEAKITEGHKFVLFTGGGRTCRKYVDALAQVSDVSDMEKDWLGISATRLNAELVKRIFGGLAYEEIIIDPTQVPHTDKPILVGAGWKPGWSTDFPPVEFAIRIGVTEVINLSNIDYVYTSDPKTDPEAQKIEDITWAEYWKLIPETWKPGMHAPFDPIASKRAGENGISVYAINGSKLEELGNCIEHRPFIGTRIHP